MPDTTTSGKPTYLGLLNAIAVGEADAEEYLNCWAETTPSPEVAGVLRTIALREGEHGKAFAKRICELGYEVRPRERDERPFDIAASATLSDREKFEKLGLNREPGDGPDIFARMFEDQNIDIQTGALLGRYIAEERDSGRMFRECYRQLCEAEENNGAGAEAEIAEIHDRLDSIERSLKRLAKKK